MPRNSTLRCYHLKNLVSTVTTEEKEGRKKERKILVLFLKPTPYLYVCIPFKWYLFGEDFPANISKLMDLFFFFFLTSLLEYNCFTKVCQFLLYNKLNQLYINIYPHIPSLLHLPPTLPIRPLYVVTKYQANLPVLCSCFPLAMYFTSGSVYKSMPFFHFVSAYPSPSLCPQVHSPRLRLYSCPAPRFFRTIFFFFRFHIYVLALLVNVKRYSLQF